MKLFFLLFILLVPAFSFADDTTLSNQLTIFDWQPDVQYSIEKQEAGMGENPGQTLFDNVANLDIVSFGSSAANLGFRLGRAVYDNHDVLHSYTVADALTFPVTLLSYSIPIGDTPISLNLGVGGSLNFLDLRQVVEGQLTNLDSLDGRLNTITAAAPPKTWMGMGIDSINNARFSDLWNVISFPARLPFKADWVQKLDIGEVIAYGADGYVEFGPSLGVVINPGALSNYVDSLNTSLDVRYYVNGEFHIAVLREDSNFVRVKIVTDGETGIRYGTSAAAKNARLFNGFMVLGVDIKPTVSVVPFNFQNVDGGGTVMEEGYRFDLRDPQARAAYEQAVIGRFAAADTLATQSVSNPNAPVQFLFHKDAKDQDSFSDHGLKIILYTMDRSTNTETTEGTLTLKDGNHKVLENVVENDFRSSFLLGGNEKIVSRTTIDFADSVLGIVFEGWIEDQITDGQELRTYETSIEQVVDRGQIFPVMPITLPHDPDDNDAPKLAAYGESSFYFRLDASQANVQTFITVPDEEKWKVLEKVLNITDGSWENSGSRAALRVFNDLGEALNFLLAPLDVRIRAIESLAVADSIHDNWVALGSIADPEQLARALGKQFADSVYGFEMIQVFTSAVHGANIPFYLTANNESFGRMSVQEGEFSTVPSLEAYREIANFDHPGPNQNMNFEVPDLRVNVLDANRVEVLFTASVKPEYLYFRVDTGGFFPDTKAELITLNTGFVNAGKNRLVLDQRDDGYDGVVAKALLAAPGPYTLSFALSAESHEWGPTSSVSVDVR